MAASGKITNREVRFSQGSSSYLSGEDLHSISYATSNEAAVLSVVNDPAIADCDVQYATAEKKGQFGQENFVHGVDEGKCNAFNGRRPQILERTRHTAIIDGQQSSVATSDEWSLQGRKLCVVRKKHQACGVAAVAMLVQDAEKAEKLLGDVHGRIIPRHEHDLRGSVGGPRVQLEGFDQRLLCGARLFVGLRYVVFVLLDPLLDHPTEASDPPLDCHCLIRDPSVSYDPGDVLLHAVDPEVELALLAVGNFSCLVHTLNELGRVGKHVEISFTLGLLE